MKAAGIVGNGAILKAIDDEHIDNVKAAHAIYEARMKPVRAELQAARRAWERAQAAACAAEIKHDAERKENVGEAQRRRTELRRAVTGARPVRIADLAKVAVTSPDGSKVSVPRLRCVEKVEAHA